MSELPALVAAFSRIERELAIFRLVLGRLCQQIDEARGVVLSPVIPSRVVLFWLEWEGTNSVQNSLATSRRRGPGGNSHGAHSSARTWNNARIVFREVDSLKQISTIELG